ncbi:MAG TPA: discoidin domain-containing protein, partial [Luteolibacter sp.]
GGLIQLSSTCNWDTPEMHWGILETSGGKCHTDKKEDKPWVTARLGKLGDVSGIIIANGDNNNASRLTPLTVSISEDGQQWHEIFRTTQAKGPWRIDLQGKAPRVQYVKVMRDDDRKEFFHLSSILVYGRRLQ